MSEGAKVRPVPQDELDVSYSGPAPAANRFIINISPIGVRIAFMEQVPNSSKNYFRSAATVSVADAIQLYHILSDMLAPLEQAESRAQEQAAAETATDG